MRNEIQIKNLVVKITKFQLRMLTWAHKVIFGHSKKLRACCDQASVSEPFAYK